MFSGIMNATRYPQHTSRYAQWYYEDDINWWKTPALSPDLNLIENAMKLYLRDQVKPKNLMELKAGIRMYW